MILLILCQVDVDFVWNATQIEVKIGAPKCWLLTTRPRRSPQPPLLPAPVPLTAVLTAALTAARAFTCVSISRCGPRPASSPPPSTISHYGWLGVERLRPFPSHERNARRRGAVEGGKEPSGHLPPLAGVTPSEPTVGQGFTRSYKWSFEEQGESGRRERVPIAPAPNPTKLTTSSLSPTSKQLLFDFRSSISIIGHRVLVAATKEKDDVDCDRRSWLGQQLASSFGQQE